MPETMDIDADQVEDTEAYPVKVTLRHLAEAPLSHQSTVDGPQDGPNGMFRSNLSTDPTEQTLRQAKANPESYIEEVRAKYMVGTDGAHSWTRRQIASIMEGEQTDFIWYYP
jgi:phenol 2-monooxygenase